MKISQLDSIIDTVNKYGTGITNGDVDLLRSAFHPKAMMYGCNGDNVTIVEIEGLFAYVASQQPPVVTGEQHRCIIKNIDVSGKCANAEVLQENCYGMNYINFFQLLQIDDRWLIVSKAYDVVQQESADDKTHASTQVEHHS
jgi:hypothetical protein